jgi:hypothetical protein
MLRTPATLTGSTSCLTEWQHGISDWRHGGDFLEGILAMRHLKWLTLALFLAAPFGSPAAQAAMPSAGLVLKGAPNVVEVAVRCGRGAHYVRGHRARNGRWIKGRCVWNRRRR